MRKHHPSRNVALILLLLFLLSSCALLLPTQTTTPDNPPPAPSSLEKLRLLLDRAEPIAVNCTIVYEDPNVGIPLEATTSLSYSGNEGTLLYSYDRLNPIGTGDFTSTVSGSVTGDLETLSSALSGTNRWVWDNTIGASLPEINLSQSCLEEYAIEENDGKYLLTATPKQGMTSTLVGLAFAEASELTLQIQYSESEISLVRLNYSIGAASYSVTAEFSYPEA